MCHSSIYLLVVSCQDVDRCCLHAGWEQVLAFFAIRDLISVKMLFQPMIRKHTTAN